MKHLKWITCIWPGLSRLWLHGQWTGLAIAAGFGVIFNLAIILEFQLTGEVYESVQAASLLVALAFWIGGCLDGMMVTVFYRRQQKLSRQRHSEVIDTTKVTDDSENLANSNDGKKLDDSSDAVEEFTPESSQTITDDLFIQARNQYLKGNWLKCEILLDSALEEFPGDLECRLLLISLLRLTKRYEDALVEITQFQKWDGAEKWDFEITREVELLDRILSKLEDSEITQAA